MVNREDTTAARGGGPLLHVGYHKTGTTWLQVELFLHPEYGFELPWSQDEVVRRFVFTDPFSFDADGTRAAMQAGLDSARALGRVAVITHERLSGSPFSGGYDSFWISGRLHAVFPEARVFIVIREQKKMLLSVYKQYVAEGGTASLATFLGLPERHRAHIPLYRREFHEYHRLIGRYRSLFGAERVLVLPYEMFRSARDAFVARLCEFAGVDLPAGLPDRLVNVSLGAMTVALRRRANLLFSRSSLNPGGPLYFRGANLALKKASKLADAVVPDRLQRASEAQLRRILARRIGDHFAASNRETMSLTGLDLSVYGYDV